MKRKKRVLFLCMANSSRSQMAEAFINKFGCGRFEVFSCGLEIKPLDPLSIKVMCEVGIDISTQRPKDVTEYLGRMHFDYIIIVCDKALESCPRIWPGGGERLYWPFKDPANIKGTEKERLAEYRNIRDQIQDKIISWLGPDCALFGRR